MEIILPSSWMEIPGSQVVKLMGLVRNPGTQNEFFLKAFLLITSIRPVKSNPVSMEGQRLFWFRLGKAEFLLSNRQLTDASLKLSFLLDDQKIPVPQWRGSRFRFIPPVYGLYNLTVGQYLNCENHFAAYSSNGDEKHLVKMALNLWVPKWFTRKPDQLVAKLSPEVKTVISLFYTGSRQFLSEQFPNIFKPAPEGTTGSGDITQLLRTLNGGDVTRNESILKVSLWDALKQLEDMALQAEQIKQSLKK